MTTKTPESPHAQHGQFVRIFPEGASELTDFWKSPDGTLVTSYNVYGPGGRVIVKEGDWVVYTSNDDDEPEWPFLEKRYGIKDYKKEVK